MANEEQEILGGHVAQWVAAVLAQEVRCTPAVDIYDDGQELLVLAEMPGVTIEGLEVYLEGQLLHIEGTQVEAEGPALHFVRALRLPFAVDSRRLRIEVANGVASIRLARGVPTT